jgi:hypothetical protein
MKLKLAIGLFASVFLTLLISSYREGPAYYAGYDCTGATGTRIGCGGGGCHGSTSSNAVTIELDSAGIAVTSYYPGMAYTVKLSGTNGTGQTLPKFGFQMASVKLAGAGTSTPSQGGTWDSTSLPTKVQYTPAGTCQVCSNWPIPIVEHNASITATSGSGANGTTYVESIGWTAPDSGTGSIKLYGVINAVNGDNNNSGDYSQAATAVTITEAVKAHINTGINNLGDKLSGWKVYPTLMSENLTMSFDLHAAGPVTATLLSINGQMVKTLMTEESLPEGLFNRTFDVNGLAPGIYLVRLQMGDQYAVCKVVKQ